MAWIPEQRYTVICPSVCLHLAVCGRTNDDKLWKAARATGDNSRDINHAGCEAGEGRRDFPAAQVRRDNVRRRWKHQARAVRKGREISHGEKGERSPVTRDLRTEEKVYHHTGEESG